MWILSGEVVIKPDNAKRDGIINALLSFDMYFKSDPDVKIYGTFDGYKNVLFNVSQWSQWNYDVNFEIFKKTKTKIV